VKPPLSPEERQLAAELVDRRAVLCRQREGLLARADKLDAKIDQIDVQLRPFLA
jgi:hypothetical protein